MTWPSQYSLLWYLVEKNLRILRLQKKAASSKGKLSPDFEKLAELFRTDLKSLVQAGDKVADLIVLATFSTRLRVDQSLEEQKQAASTSLYYMPYMSIPGLIEGYRTYNSIIRDVARESGVLLVGHEDSIPGDAIHFVDSVHFTDLGSQAMAERIFTAITASENFRRLVATANLANIPVTPVRK